MTDSELEKAKLLIIQQNAEILRLKTTFEPLGNLTLALKKELSCREKDNSELFIRQKDAQISRLKQAFKFRDELASAFEKELAREKKVKLELEKKLADPLLVAQKARSEALKTARDVIKMTGFAASSVSASVEDLITLANYIISANEKK